MTQPQVPSQCSQEMKNKQKKYLAVGPAEGGPAEGGGRADYGFCCYGCEGRREGGRERREEQISGLFFWKGSRDNSQWNGNQIPYLLGRNEIPMFNGNLIPKVIPFLWEFETYLCTQH